MTPDIMNIIYAILVLGVLGAIFGGLLAFAAKIFHVDEDERIGQVRECLAGANCGGCGYAGCDAYAAGEGAGGGPPHKSGRPGRKTDGAGAPIAKRILEAAAQPIHQQMKANASKDPKIITGVLNRSIRIGPVKKRRKSGKSITIGVHRKEEGAYYATPVEYGHGGPAPAPAHPFIRPAYDTRADEAYQIIRDGLRDAVDRL